MIVLSSDPDTIEAPFGENWTEVMQPPCAFCFSAIIARDSAPAVFSKGLVRRGSWAGSWGLAAHPTL